MLEILHGTPWWVYLLFVFLVLIGLRATRPRWVSLRQLMTLPLIFMALNVSWLSERLQGQYYHLIFWVAGLLFGMAFGWVLVRHWKIDIEKRRQALYLPATWSSFILILLFFSIRYFFNYNYEVYPQAGPHLFLADSIISGVMTGVVIGRSLQLYGKYLKHKSHF